MRTSGNLRVLTAQGSPRARKRLFPDSHSEFFRWFGRSMVVSENGDPRIVYHGTTSAFAEFLFRKTPATLGFHFGTLSQAEFFAGVRENSRAWSGGNVRPAYLRIERPLRTPDIFCRGRDGAAEIADWLLRQELIRDLALARIHNARTVRDAYACITPAIENAGYDGVVYANEHEGGSADTNEDAFIVFRSEQIRSIFEPSVVTALGAARR